MVYFPQSRLSPLFNMQPIMAALVFSFLYKYEHVPRKTRSCLRVSVSSLSAHSPMDIPGTRR